MSDAKGQQHEPSMEEILASIRRIIAEDSDGSAPAPEPAADPMPPALPAEPQDEVLELTEVAEAESSVVALHPPPPKLDLAPEPPPVRVAPEPPPEPMEAEEPILSAETAAASVAALAQITALSAREEPRRDLALGGGSLTLEAIVRQELRPILKDWLDRYLPDMVQRLVQQEIARLVSDVPRR